MRRDIDILSLYGRDMNIYGDTGNILTIVRRLDLYGYHPIVHMYNPGDKWPHYVDLIVGGGGQDSGQERIYQDLLERKNLLADLALSGTPMLVICGMYQLFGKSFRTYDGKTLEGIGVFDAVTQAGEERLIGNVIERTRFGDIYGYENHSGQTFLQKKCFPFGIVKKGEGNNKQDSTEGAVFQNVIGTYMHGSVLPKNPRLADFLIRRAALSRYGTFDPHSTAEQQKELENLDFLAEKTRKVLAQRPR